MTTLSLRLYTEREMPLNIRSETVNELAHKLAERRRVSKTEAVRIALENELRREDQSVPLWERIRPLRETIARYPDSGEQADKAYFDDLSGDY
jgi:antitoxin VapB